MTKSPVLSTLVTALLAVISIGWGAASVAFTGLLTMPRGHTTNVARRYWLSVNHALVVAVVVRPVPDVILTRLGTVPLPETTYFVYSTALLAVTIQELTISSIALSSTACSLYQG